MPSNTLLQKLPSLDEIKAERQQRAQVRAQQIDPSDIRTWVEAVYMRTVWEPGAETGKRYIYPKQLSIFELARDCGQISVCGSNGSGKDWTSARIALWWIKRWQHEGQTAMVIITAPTSRQIEHIIWQELRAAYLDARLPLGGTLYEEPRLRWDEQTFILGFATDKPYKVQGFHSAHLLVIVSEAHGVAQSHIDVLWRLNPNCMLLTGNPISESGEFYDSHHSKMDMWHTVNIDAWDTPNVIEGHEVVPGLVTLEDIERGKRNWGEDSPLYRISFKNEWVEGMGQLVVVPLSWVKRAETNWDSEAFPLGKVGVLGVDVARYGQDKSVIYLRRGRVAKKLLQVQGAPTTDISEWLIQYHQKYRDVHIVVDGVGIGAGVIDQCRKAGLGIIEFQGGASASDPAHYFDRNAEVWWHMREAFEHGLAVQPDGELATQISSRRYKIDAKDRRIRLERKEDMRKEGRHSPDTGDALAMTFAVDWRVTGDRLTAGSDVDTLSDQDATGEEMLIGSQDSRMGWQGVGRRGGELAPRHDSRWSGLRRGRLR